MSSLSVRLTNAELIGRVIMRASEELDARVDGPRWLISAENPAWLEAATQAAANARAKATAYASGVQARLGPPLALSEPETGQWSHQAAGRPLRGRAIRYANRGRRAGGQRGYRRHVCA